MRIVIFFQFLILFLLRNEGSLQVAVAPTHFDKYPTTLSNQLTSPELSFNNKNTSTLVSCSELSGQSELLVWEEVEEDECPNVFVKKFNSSGKNYSIQLYSALSGDPIHRSKAAQCFYGRVSYKYIQQRILRV